MSTCVNCGHELGVGRFCTNCGHPVGAPAPDWRTDTATAAQLDRLTEREREVLLSVAQGASNTEISAELFIGPATVKTHVSSLLTKLGLRDRTQLVVFAYESGLVEAGRQEG